ncbi:MAG: phosphotransferase [Clostridium sp.]|uniref:Bifunctional protein GlmU n=1 Tax=Clostridium paraputrificum TaxID=29363 RepID=A0A6N3DG92_9CLOT|nr:phosphotransferase [Clostridium sp.]MBS5927988.1 phosphotransferase [Clostridium sp.]MBS5987618.1 phosphotransferase [Clostridium sp.]
MDKFNVLKLILEDSCISQRKISELLNISLGKVNSILKESIQNREIDIIKNGNKVIYRITDLGKECLEENLKNIKENQLEIDIDKVNVVTEAVILAAGKRKDFDIPVAALSLEDTTIIQRNIKILRDNGIRKIVVIAGYNKEMLYNLLKEEKDVILVDNDRYSWTGNMQSLALAKNIIENDFVLIEGDLIFEESVISKLISNDKRNTIIITNESGSGDEGFVQLKDGYLFKLAKDIHQFNRIDGEMIGISKISINLFKLMLQEFESNVNPYLNYDYMLLDVSRDYKVPCLKIDDLTWGEIDTEDQYGKVVNNIYPKIMRKEKNSKYDYVRDIASEVFQVDRDKIKEVSVAGGLTNNNYKVNVDGDYYIVRVPGVGTEKMISRKYEMINSKLASEQGINVDIAYFNEESGIKISKFIEDAETLTNRSSKKQENMKLVSQIIKELHESSIVFENEFNVFEEIELYEDIINQLNGKFFDDYIIVKEKVMNLKALIKEYGARYVPSHNDTLPDNFVKDTNGRLYLIDWEYSGINEEMWDLAAHTLEAEFSEEEEREFLRYYFGREATREERVRLLINKICQDFLWAIWTLIKEAEGEDFGTYGIDRYNRAKINLNNLFNIL